MKNERLQEVIRKSSFWNVEAQAILSTAERQARGLERLFDDGTPDTVVTPDTIRLANMVTVLQSALAKLAFDNAALRGEIEPPSAAPSPEELADAGPQDGDKPAHGPAADFYGYHGASYTVLIGSVDGLTDRALAGDSDATHSLSIRARQRGSEIMRLKERVRKMEEKYLPPAEPEPEVDDAVLSRPTGHHHF